MRRSAMARAVIYPWPLGHAYCRTCGMNVSSERVSIVATVGVDRARFRSKQVTPQARDSCKECQGDSRTY